MLDPPRRPLGVRATYVLVALAATVAVLMRLPFQRLGTYTDEGGMLVVAHRWHAGGRFLDPDGSLQRTLDQHYHALATVCGATVYVAPSFTRAVPPPPVGCS